MSKKLATAIRLFVLLAVCCLPACGKSQAGLPEGRACFCSLQRFGRILFLGLVLPTYGQRKPLRRLC